MIVEICKICGKEFNLGFDGTVDGCDSCTGVKRDKNGYAYDADEVEQGAWFANVDGSDAVLTPFDPGENYG